MKSMRLGAAVLAATFGLAACTDPPPPPTSPPQNPITLGAGNVLGNAAFPTWGGPESAGARFASVSGDGDIVAFVSSASNLVPGDTNGEADVFVRVRSTGAVERIAEVGLGDPRVSSNGRYVSFASINSMNVFDRVTGSTNSWQIGNGGTFAPVVPDDGSVAIYGARNPFGGGPFAWETCIVRDLATGAEQDCPHGDPGTGIAAINGVSANGRFVVYTWSGTSPGGVVDTLLWDRVSNTTVSAPLPSDLSAYSPVLVSDNGRFLAVTRQVAPYVVVTDRVAGTSQPMPGIAPGEFSLLAGMSRDGRYYAVTTSATLVASDTNAGDSDVYLWDRVTGDVILRSYDQATGLAGSADSRYCGGGPGQVTDAGEVCVMSDVGLIAADTNGVSDAYLR